MKQSDHTRRTIDAITNATLADRASEVQVCFAVPADDEISDGLRLLTFAVEKSGLASGERGGLFGGEWGYGADFANDAFSLHRYCWCEEDSCLWCGDCDCPMAPSEHYLDGALIGRGADGSWGEANDRLLGPFRKKNPGRREEAAFDRVIEERNRRLVTVHAARTHVCPPAGLRANRDAGLDWRPDQRAPNFWHKSSGWRVWWYKYIGRDMEIAAGTAPWADVLVACCASLGEPSVEALRVERDAELERMIAEQEAFYASPKGVALMEAFSHSIPMEPSFKLFDRLAAPQSADTAPALHERPRRLRAVRQRPERSDRMTTTPFSAETTMRRAVTLEANAAPPSRTRRRRRGSPWAALWSMPRFWWFNVGLLTGIVWMVFVGWIHGRW